MDRCCLQSNVVFSCATTISIIIIIITHNRAVMSCPSFEKMTSFFSPPTDLVLHFPPPPFLFLLLLVTAVSLTPPPSSLSPPHTPPLCLLAPTYRFSPSLPLFSPPLLIYTAVTPSTGSPATDKFIFSCASPSSFPPSIYPSLHFSPYLLLRCLSHILPSLLSPLCRFQDADKGFRVFLVRLRQTTR